jgi:glyoxylase-like metal-dependent hydrolase (beta-lactamase superfamily II)
MEILPIDVGYLGVKGAANAFLVRGPQGHVLVECGPAACFDTLVAGLRSHGCAPSDIGDLLLTHIHLDHAGGAGHLAAHGARVHVHPFGHPHLADPAKLIASSRRVHGSAYDRFYGDMLPVPETSIIEARDGVRLVMAGLRWRAFHTPGHARHHVVWMLEHEAERHAFLGDLAGILVPESRHIAVPTPPPEFDPQAWRASLGRVFAEGPSHLWLTHGGCVANQPRDAEAFLHRALARLAETTEWLRRAVQRPEPEAIREGLKLERSLATEHGVNGRRMDEFIDEAFVRMNLGGARRAFLPRD